MIRAPAVFGALIALASCDSYDNSSDTDRSRGALTNAQSAVSEQSSDVVVRANDIEREKRALVQRQQQLVDDEKALAGKRQQLGSARDDLVRARATYASATESRLSKLDATLATLATRTEATTKDAVVGLRARRESLALKVRTLAAVGEQDWAAYMVDVDATFDAIERDLHAAR